MLELAAVLIAWALAFGRISNEVFIPVRAAAIPKLIVVYMRNHN